jgi:hypothetical protein
LISANRLVDISRRELVKLLIVTEDDDRDINLAEDRKFVRLLEEASLSLEESPIYLVSIKKLTECDSCIRWNQSRLRSTYTERFLSSLMALISIFLRPIAATIMQAHKDPPHTRACTVGSLGLGTFVFQ